MLVELELIKQVRGNDGQDEPSCRMGYSAEPADALPTLAFSPTLGSALVGALAHCTTLVLPAL